MPVVVITPPTPAVTAAEAKMAGVFASTDADAMVDALLGAAQAAIDGPDGWLGRSIGVQTLELRQPAFDRWRLTLPCGPVIEVLSIKYGPADTTWPAEQYALLEMKAVVQCQSRNWYLTEVHFPYQRKSFQIRSNPTGDGHGHAGGH